jgi:hypothetical protein
MGMGSPIEDAIVDMIRDVIEDQVDIPDEEEIEKIAQSALDSHLESNLADEVANALTMDRSVRRAVMDLMLETMKEENVVSDQDLKDLRVDMEHEIERRCLRYKLKAIRQRVRSWFSWSITGKRKNARKVRLWTVIV